MSLEKILTTTAITLALATAPVEAVGIDYNNLNLKNNTVESQSEERESLLGMVTDITIENKKVVYTIKPILKDREKTYHIKIPDSINPIIPNSRVTLQLTNVKEKTKDNYSAEALVAVANPALQEITGTITKVEPIVDWIKSEDPTGEPYLDVVTHQYTLETIKETITLESTKNYLNKNETISLAISPITKQILAEKQYNTNIPYYKDTELKIINRESIE